MEKRVFSKVPRCSEPRSCTLSSGTVDPSPMCRDHDRSPMSDPTWGQTSRVLFGHDDRDIKYLSEGRTVSEVQSERRATRRYLGYLEHLVCSRDHLFETVDCISCRVHC